MCPVLSEPVVLTSTKLGVRRVLGDRRVRRIKARRLRLAERLPGIPAPATGLNGLDQKLIALVAGAGSATFLEFGANDGLQQSNTYVLERDHGWRGALVEPLPHLAAECRMNRPEASVVCAAVSSADLAGSTLRFADDDLMTHQGDGPHIAVATTMSAIIADLLGGEVGLVVVDVEGAELAALDGLDLSRHRPEFLLIETARPREVAAVLGVAYGEAVPLTHHDYLFRRS